MIAGLLRNALEISLGFHACWLHEDNASELFAKAHETKLSQHHGRSSKRVAFEHVIPLATAASHR